MVDIAFELLSEHKNSPQDYHSILKQIAEIKGMTEEEMNDRIAHLYTELTIDGRFINLGDNQWGLREWYTFDQTEEEFSKAARARKKKDAEDEELDDDLIEEEEFDDFEDLEDELDELANEEDDFFGDDDNVDDFDDDLDVDFDDTRDDNDDLL